MLSNSILGVVFLAMAPAAYAHMILSNPVPYGNPTSSPLSASGSDFPCQNVAYTATKVNELTVGETMLMSWKGGAVHGGGSCQVALTTDKEPTKDSKWKVIHSIEGGCPLSEIPIPIPEEVPSGEMALAVTWYNKIGNREIYMNCAPVAISGGSDDISAFESLPDLALANIAVGEGANCKTKEMFDYTFENPGKYVTRIGNGPFVSLCGGAASGGNAQPGAPNGKSPVQAPNDGKYTPVASQAPTSQTPVSEATISQAPAPSAPASQAPSSPVNSTMPLVVTSTVRTLLTVTATATAGRSSKVSQGPASSTPAPQATQAPFSNSTVGGGQGICTTDGELICNGETQFGLCNHGKVVWQNVAAGTKCTNGKIAKREYTHRAQRSLF
jgi:hypothetical protein